MLTRPVSGLWGGRRGTGFAGKASGTGGAHPVVDITRPISGLWGGRNSGSFSGKGGALTSAAITRPVSGLWGGRKNASFSGKTLSIVVTPEIKAVKYGGGFFQPEPTPIKKKKRVEVTDNHLLAQLHAEDDLVLQIIMAAVTQELIS